MKTFFFQFINSYASLFYIAFVKANEANGDYCHDLEHFNMGPKKIKRDFHDANPYCLDELATQLTSLVIFSQITGKLIEYAQPKLKSVWRTWSEERSMRKAGKEISPMTPVEAQAMLSRLLRDATVTTVSPPPHAFHAVTSLLSL